MLLKIKQKRFNMKKEINPKFKILIKEYLEKKSLFLYKEIYASGYSFHKSKGERNDYFIDSFIEKFSLPTVKDSEYYRLWAYIYQKDINLAYEIVTSYVKYPTTENDESKYTNAVLEIYTNHKKDNKILWSIINNKSFLNNNLILLQELFEENVLNNIQKKEVVQHYIQSMESSKKLNTLENKRLITLLNKKLIKPLEIELIKEDALEIKTKTETCIYFEVTVQELMGYSLKLSDKYSEHLLANFAVLLPQVLEAETTDVIERKKLSSQSKNIEGYGYAILTNLEDKLIKKIFNCFVDSYIEIIDNKNKFPTQADMLDCLKFAVLKSRKENLENNLMVKNTKSQLKKI